MSIKEQSNNPDMVLIGAGIMSATLGVLLKQLQPDITIEIFEPLMLPQQKALMPGIMQEQDIRHFANLIIHPNSKTEQLRQAKQ
jgi:hypothetical protein